MTPVLEVSGLAKTFGGGRNNRALFGRAKPPVHAVRDLSFSVGPGETLGIVGESGCGKTTLARMLAGLLPPSSGRIVIEGEDCTRIKGSGRRVQYVFQDPLGALNPRKKIRQIMAAPLRYLLGMDASSCNARIAELFDAVGLRKEFLDRYPHEFSGGQAQRISIARALAANPRIIVLDEPVSALDVSVQAQVLNLLTDLRVAYNFVYLLISHDLAVVETISDRVAVLYAGRIVELTDSADIFSNAKHPYTRLLADSAPVIGQQLPVVAGETGNPTNDRNVPAGCAFAGRCTRVRDNCRRTEPGITHLRDQNYVRCFYPLNE